MAKTEKPSAGKASDKKVKKPSTAAKKELRPEGTAEEKPHKVLDEPRVPPRLRETYRSRIIPALMKEF
jgi:hypothetical protein